jgi:poly(3-hydroxybutyrate) depolymerase
MNSEFIQDQFAKTAGYNEWAESNDIIVIYPQAAKGILNPKACWDWFGYTGLNYSTKFGTQMSALMKMIQHLERR